MKATTFRTTPELRRRLHEHLVAAPGYSPRGKSRWVCEALIVMTEEDPVLRCVGIADKLEPNSLLDKIYLTSAAEVALRFDIPPNKSLMSPYFVSLETPMLASDQGSSGQPAAVRGKPQRQSRFVRVYEFGPMEMVVVIRKGLSSKELVRTSRALHLPKEHIYKMLRLPPSTTKRKLTQNEAFSPDQSERILGLQKLIGQVEVMVAESGDPNVAFDAGAWVARWLDEPSPALGNQKPGDFMDTVAGQAMVANLLAKMQSGAYA